LRKALIIGITGQDGSYLAELLLSKGYEVHGLIRRASTFNTARINHLYRDPHETGTRLFLHYGDLSDSSRITSLISALQPHEIYNLGAQSHVRVSFDEPEYTGDITGLGNARVLEAIRFASPASKFLQASSSEMFGSTPPPQNEQSNFSPKSPYAAAKLYAYWMTRNYREAHNMFAVNAIMFNHESPRRGETFVTRKITLAAARIREGTQQKLFLGNLDARRDFGYAPEYVEGIWQMMQQDKPEDFVFATGDQVSIKEFLTYVFEASDLDWQKHVEFDDKYLRPAEVDSLRGDPSKAKAVLGWEARTKSRELAEIMLRADQEYVKKEGSGWIDVPRFMNGK
jgi:GDPmannose 4,6-dehydratase